LNDKNKEVKELQKSLNSKAEGLEQKTIDEGKWEKILQTKEEEFKSIRITLGEKEQEVDKAFRNKEKGFKDKITQKDIEIKELKTHLEQKTTDEANYQDKLKAQEVELKSTKVALSEKEQEINKLNKLLRNKEDELKNKISNKNNEIYEIKTQLEQNTINEDNYKSKLQTLEEKLKSMGIVVSEKDQEIEKLIDSLKTKEVELGSKIAEKDNEISKIQTNLTARENELEMIKNRDFWQRLKACFQNQ
jgi:chromosome segregation ATPase